MKKIAVAGILLLCVSLMGATVRVGTERAAPGVMKECLELVNDIADLGTDPSGGDLNQGVAGLEDGTISVLQWEDTSVPADMCTDTVVGMTTAGTLCARKSLKPNNVVIRPNVMTFVCTDPMDSTDAKFWVRINCP